MAQQPNAILAINSLDRYDARYGLTSVDVSNLSKVVGQGPLSNDFRISSGGAIIYGYIDKIIISQIQLNYNVPTIIPTKNDEFVISWTASSILHNTVIQIPYGFYTPQELAAVIQLIIRNTDIGSVASSFFVTYSQTHNTFIFDSQISDISIFVFCFPISFTITDLLGVNYATLVKTYNMLGIGKQNLTTPGRLIQESVNAINFLYTPYVDIVSEVLTKYQNVKDTDTTARKLNSIIARLYLTGVGIPQAVDGIPVGSRSFMIVQDLNSPKIIRWSPNEAVNSFDLQVRDQYGDLLFCTIPNVIVDTYYSEFQMTLLCIEKEQY